MASQWASFRSAVCALFRSYSRRACFWASSTCSGVGPIRAGGAAVFLVALVVFGVALVVLQVTLRDFVGFLGLPLRVLGTS